jgi:hypothetical protein
VIRHVCRGDDGRGLDPRNQCQHSPEADPHGGSILSSGGTGAVSRLVELGCLPRQPRWMVVAAALAVLRRSHRPAHVNDDGSDRRGTEFVRSVKSAPCCRAASAKRAACSRDAAVRGARLLVGDRRGQARASEDLQASPRPRPSPRLMPTRMIDPDGRPSWRTEPVTVRHGRRRMDGTASGRRHRRSSDEHVPLEPSSATATTYSRSGSSRSSRSCARCDVVSHTPAFFRAGRVTSTTDPTGRTTSPATRSPTESAYASSSLDSRGSTCFAQAR